MRKIFALITVIFTIMIMTPISTQAAGIYQDDDFCIDSAIARFVVTSDNCTYLYEQVSEMKLVDVIAYNEQWQNKDQRMLVFSDEQGNVMELVFSLEQCKPKTYNPEDCKRYKIGEIVVGDEYKFVVIGYANGNVKMYFEYE